MRGRGMQEKQMFSMSELNPLCLWRRLWKNWLLILAAGLIALMGTEIAVQPAGHPESHCAARDQSAQPAGHGGLA